MSLSYVLDNFHSMNHTACPEARVSQNTKHGSRQVTACPSIAGWLRGSVTGVAAGKAGETQDAGADVGRAEVVEDELDMLYRSFMGEVEYNSNEQVREDLPFQG